MFTKPINSPEVNDNEVVLDVDDVSDNIVLF